MRRSVPFLGAVILLPVALAAQGTAVPQELTFADALHIAESANPAFRAARNLVGMAEADAREAGSRPNPVVAMEGEGYSAFTPRQRSFWNDQALTLRLTQEIETAGRRGHRVRAADAGIEVARSEVADARRRLHLEIGRAYFRLALAQADRATAAAARDELEQVIALTEARFAAGEVAGIELRRLQVERLNFVDRVFAIDLAVSNARVTLLGLLGARRPDATGRGGRSAAGAAAAGRGGAAARHDGRRCRSSWTGSGRTPPPAGPTSRRRAGRGSGRRRRSSCSAHGASRTSPPAGATAGASARMPWISRSASRCRCSAA